MTRCLWITRQDPRPADSGELIYSRGLLLALAAQGGFDIHVLCHSGTHQPPAASPANPSWHLTGTIPPKRLLSPLDQLPGDAGRLGNPGTRAALRRLLASASWDWIVIDQAACAWALDEIPAHSPAKIAYIAHNHEASLRAEVAAGHGGPLPLRLALKHDARKYARLENRLAARASLITAITPRDAAAFQAAFPDKRIAVLPPGYDGAIPAGDPSPILPATPRRVVLTGTFQWIAKRHNLEEFLAAAAGTFQPSGISLCVVGKADPAYFSRLSSLYPWAEFHPNVPSVEPYLANARLGLIPEALGGGFKLKALDYIFRGLPLAAIGPALSGLPLDPQLDTITAADTATLAAAIAKHIDSPGFLTQTARSALEKCRHAFDWNDRGRQFALALRP